MKPLLLMAAVAALSAPAAAALAHDSGWRDNRDHDRYHRQLEREHRLAHRYGFDSRWEHKRYHRARRHAHRDYHDYGWASRRDPYYGYAYRTYGYREPTRYRYYYDRRW